MESARKWVAALAMVATIAAACTAKGPDQAAGTNAPVVEQRTRRRPAWFQRTF